ncbi:MAG: SOS response-associated peptidase, partial [Pseudomonadales bacterium]|nr:SOS response-associated peptidase [Pseudomonadales bacterium]
IPFWAEDPSIGNRLINARAETAHAKPSFREAFKRRRCVIPASGFYEWRTVGSQKQPYAIGQDTGRPLLLAGLWESWTVLSQVPSGRPAGYLRDIDDASE